MAFCNQQFCKIITTLKRPAPLYIVIQDKNFQRIHPGALYCRRADTTSNKLDNRSKKRLGQKRGLWFESFKATQSNLMKQIPLSFNPLYKF